VLSERTARNRLEAAGSTSLTPLVGRESEVALLLERWAQVTDGLGQVVLLSAEAGIGKSRLVQGLKEHVASEPQAWLTPCQCSPYYQHSALYPMIELLERVALRFDREESPQQKLHKLEGFVVQYGLPLAEAVPLFAALLPLPLTTDYAPLALAPEQQKQKTLHALLMARLDRLAAVKGLAQLGGTLGREFSYELLQSVSPWGEDTLKRGLQQLVAAEFLYQQGLPPQATYRFKHALIQEAAYQSLLRSTRQQATSLELRATISLARLWQQQGKHAEARELLAPIYGWFTEGFDTADLQEAKALLDVLASS
jgi:predicted ATPase